MPNAPKEVFTSKTTNLTSILNGSANNKTETCKKCRELKRNIYTVKIIEMEFVSTQTEFYFNKIQRCQADIVSNNCSDRIKTANKAIRAWVPPEIPESLQNVLNTTTGHNMILFDENYDGYDIHALTNVGVNIFNIDMTQHNAEFFHIIKDAMEFSANMPEMIPTAYYTPVGLSVTMSANDPIDIDDRVDIIILKDIMSVNQLRQFKKQNKKISSMPILFWPPKLEIKDLYEIMKISAGIVMDPTLSNIFCNFDEVLRRCREARKPVFFMNPTLADNYYEKIANDRQLLIQVHDLIKNRLDGIFLKDERRGKPPIEFIQALIRATEILEKNYVAASDYFKLSFPMKIPVLQPYAAALAASLAALQSGASAIIVFTTTGASAKILSCTLPPCRVIAITRHEKTARRMHLFRKIMPLHYRESRFSCWQDESLARIAFGTQFGLDTGLFDFAAKLVVLAPSEEGIGYCNSFQILTVKHVLHRYQCGKYSEHEVLLQI